MLTFISCAKTMTSKSKIVTPATSQPLFMNDVHHQVRRMATLSSENLGKLLKINNKLAAQNTLRYQEFYAEHNIPLPALLSYTGMVFKHIAPHNFSTEDFLFAQEHLRISSFLYGLLRPLDLIRNYRLEGHIPYDTNQSESIFAHWRPILTPHFIKDIQAHDNILINLASAEMKELFQWEDIEQSVRVITPEFYTLKNGKPTMVTVYAKMCRGEMTSFIIRNRIHNPEQLKEFSWEGFIYSHEMSSDNRMAFVLQA